MSALGTLRTYLSTLPGPVDVDRNERLIQAFAAEVLRDAADALDVEADETWFPGRTAHTVMQQDADRLRRRADEIERYLGIGGS